MDEYAILETLKEIKEQNRKKLLYQKCLTAFMLVITIAFLAVVPGVLSTIQTAKTTMASLNITIGKMDTALDAITEIAQNSSQGMEEALENINSIDIDTLNDAIYDLNEVVKPMADFFGKFK